MIRGFKHVFSTMVVLVLSLSSVSNAEDYPQDGYFEEFDQKDSSFYMTKPTIEHIAGTWEPTYLATSNHELIPKRNEQQLVIPFGTEVQRVTGKILLKNSALSANPNEAFACRVSDSGSMMICKSSCGKFYRVFEKGIITTESASLD